MIESSPYSPIDCGPHSRFELAVMRARPLILGWRQPDGVVRRELVLPLDLATRDGGEYLLVEAGGERLQLRLDRIVDSDALRCRGNAGNSHTRLGSAG